MDVWKELWVASFFRRLLKRSKQQESKKKTETVSPGFYVFGISFLISAVLGRMDADMQTAQHNRE